MENIKADLLGIIESMRDKRRPYETTLQEIQDYFMPRRLLFNMDGVDPKSAASIRTNESYDDTASVCVRQFTDAIHGYMVSKSLHWFKQALTPASLEDLPGVRSWLQETENAMYAELQRSNFYDASTEILDDGATVGTAIMFMENDPGKDCTYFSPRHPGEINIAENMFGVVDTVSRTFWLTTKQVLETFGDKMGEKWLNANKKNMMEDHKFHHLILPQGTYFEGKFNNGNYAFASYYLCESCEDVVEVGGYDSNPYIVWRFRKNSNEVWGRSLAWDSLTTAKRLNLMVQQNLTSGQLAVFPPMQVPAEIQAQAPDWIKPRSIITYNNPNRLIQPIRMGGEAFQIAKAEEEMVRNNLRLAMMSDFFLMMNQQSNKSLTATQVMEMAGEKYSMLGTMVSRVESEYLDPTLNRLYDIMVANNRIKPPPPALAELPRSAMRIDYIGPLAQSQKRYHTSQASRQTIAQIAELASLDKGVLDWINFDKQGRKIAIDGGLSFDVIRSDEEVKKIRMERQKAAEQQQQMMMAIQAMQSSNKLSKEPEPGSPMESVGPQLLGMEKKNV